MELRLRTHDASHPLSVEQVDEERMRVEIDGVAHDVKILDAGPPTLVLVEGVPIEVTLVAATAYADGSSAEVLETSFRPSCAPSVAPGVRVVLAPMPGRVVTVHCKPGDHVEVDAPLLVLEAMKMENDVRAPVAGVIESVFVSAGASLETGAPLLKFEGE